MESILIQLLNGLVTGMLLFVMAAGLSLIFGLMDVINLAHGALYLLGGYVGLSILRYFDNFWLALLLTPLLVGGIGLLIELVFLQRWHGRGRHLDQVLFTLGLALITTDLTRAQWGAFVEKVPEPAQLAGRINRAQDRRGDAGLWHPAGARAVVVRGAHAHGRHHSRGRL